MIAIFGARGVGKTTLLFQYLKELQNNNKKALYISMDYPFLVGVDLLDIVENFIDDGGEYLLLDEVHRYNDFSSYLKTIYDLYDIKVIFTGSSATSILNAKSDLSRRVTLYNLNGFSFREYLELKFDFKLQEYSIENLIEKHIEIANTILIKKESINIVNEFNEYLKIGYYPFYFDKQTSYYHFMHTVTKLKKELLERLFLLIRSL